MEEIKGKWNVTGDGETFTSTLDEKEDFLGVKMTSRGKGIKTEFSHS